jgi:hypothetical protein
MPNDIVQVADDYWNIRGSFRVGGVFDVGTQASLVRLASGNFIFLGAYSLVGEPRRRVNELTAGGEKVDAILNPHPFHTVHVRRMHELFPQAQLYGTARHLERFPELPWEQARLEDAALHQQYASTFEFSVPSGVDFISANENVHFSSVLVYHRASRTIHSDDTLMYIRLPSVLRMLGLADRLGFHPTLAKALEKRSGAAQDFRDWAKGLIDGWGDAENVCAAHTAALLAADNDGATIRARLKTALARVEKTLAAHERKYG